MIHDLTSEETALILDALSEMKLKVSYKLFVKILTVFNAKEKANGPERRQHSEELHRPFGQLSEDREGPPLAMGVLRE